MTMTFIYLLCIFAINTYIVNAAENFDPRCIRVPLKENFDIAKVSGTWYVQAVGDEDEATKRCSNFTMNAQKTKNESALIISRIYLRNSKNITDSYKLRQVKDYSVFTMTFRGQTIYSWVIDTDFKSYISWYGCIPEQNDKGILHITTREKFPNKKILERAIVEPKKIGFSVTEPYLKIIDQNNCN